MAKLSLGETNQLAGRPLCPYCGSLIDRATHADANRPTGAARPNDVSICGYCAEIMVFDSTLSLRKPTEDERNEIMSYEHVRQLRFAIMMTRIELGRQQP